MGHGKFSRKAYAKLSKSKAYDTKSRSQIFTSANIDPEMDPKKATTRESRDSEEHPNSLAIIVGLDVTGSMGFVPEDIVKNTLPDLVETIIEAGYPDPQVLFIGLGDFVYDRAPLQVGQFESSTELLDRWLTKVYLEGGGGGNEGESYNLAYLFAARHTAIDCWEKRRQRGFLFTIGDEPCLANIPADIITRLTPASQASTITTADMLKEAQEKYKVYHMHLDHNNTARLPHRRAGWKELLGQNLTIVQDYKQVAKKIAHIVINDLDTVSTTNPFLNSDSEEEIL